MVSRTQVNGQVAADAPVILYVKLIFVIRIAAFTAASRRKWIPLLVVRKVGCNLSICPRNAYADSYAAVVPARFPAHEALRAVVLPPRPSVTK